jgi:isoquinoline 1-oxidoreductase
MNDGPGQPSADAADCNAAVDAVDAVGYDFGFSRRSFVQSLGAGLLITVAASTVVKAQERRARGGGAGGRGGRGGGGGAPANLDARLHIGADGVITVMTGKVECGQGARAQITQAAAEELGVPVGQVVLVMADTSLTPDDGMTAGSRTTPSTLPAIRKACAAARQLLADFAAKQPDGRAVTYADLAKAQQTAELFKKPPPDDVKLTPVESWKILGADLPRPNARDLVAGTHKYPSDVARPGMLYGGILRPPSYGAKLTDIDLGPAKAMEGVAVVRDGDFVGVAAPKSHLARRALAELEKTAKWDAPPHPSSASMPKYLRDGARIPANPNADVVKAAAKSLTASYDVAYVQHAPMEPRAAVAEWSADGSGVTVWTGTQGPSRVRQEIADAFHIPREKVRVIVPDFGGGFGGKHTGECAVEAARLAKGAGKPVSLRWTREEEFTWAYFRPAAAIDIEAALDEHGKLAAWHFVNVNSGGAGLESPYRVAKKHEKYVSANKPPLRHGSYRALASTANAFARESVMDELAALAGADPLAFRLDHLDEPRLRNVLTTAAEKFGWSDGPRKPNGSGEQRGVGLACATEKGSFVAACAEVAVDRAKGTITVVRVCQAFECGKITSPGNLRSQVAGAIVMGLGPALREAMVFEDGKMTNASFWQYEIPRMKDLPELDVHLLDRPDLPSTGAGETPLIAVAPAIANAVFRATGQRLRQMPLRLASQA